MSENYTYPGVYIREEVLGAPAISGVSTSITAFIGYANSDEISLEFAPQKITSYSQYEKIFGKPTLDSDLAQSMRLFFLNGGNQCYVVNVNRRSGRKAFTFVHLAEKDDPYTPLDRTLWEGGIPVLIFRAKNRGEQFNYIKVGITKGDPPEQCFNIHILMENQEGKEIYSSDYFNCDMTNVERKITDFNPFVECVVLYKDFDEEISVNNYSNLTGPMPGYTFPDLIPLFPLVDEESTDEEILEDNSEENLGDPIKIEKYLEHGTYDVFDTVEENYIKAIESLERIDIFNLMVITKCEAMNNNDGIYRRILTRAVEFCEDQRAFLLIDPFYSWHPSDISQTQNIIENISEVRSIIPQHQCAVYYPFLMISESDPVTRDEFLREIGPAAAVAGVIARIDSQRGVWKAPAGIEAMLTGFERLSVNLTDDENGDLNVLGVNCIRAFISGITCWGARTVAGFDNSGTAWKYISTRRLTLFIEETLYRATRWVVFEPNDEPLWAKIRSSINPFMLDLYEKGAFQGTPDQAFFVKCDSETTTTEDQENGIVNIIVGFAPVKPAEFVIITIQRIMGKLS